MSKTFFTADTHFGSEVARKFTWTRHIFSSVYDMDETIIENWNDLVSPEDTVYHLGDFCHKDSTYEDYKSYRARLNGKIILLKGNHDLLEDSKLKSIFGMVLTYPTDYFHGDQNFWLCHYPVQRDMDFYTLTGHIHEKWRVAQKMLNVGVDVSNFKPLTMEDIMFCVNAETGHHWDANVYPDAPIEWRWEVTKDTTRNRESEPTYHTTQKEMWDKQYERDDLD